MELEVIPLEILGLKTDMRAAVQVLQRLHCVQIDELDQSLGDAARPLSVGHEILHTQEELKSLAARVEGLLDVLDGRQTVSAAFHPNDPLTEARAGVEELVPKVQSLVARSEELRADLAALPRYEVTLRKLLPIVPPSAYEPGNVCIGALVSREHMDALDLISRRAFACTGGRAEAMVGDVDGATRAMLLVFPSEFTDEMEELLGREDVSRLRLPPELGQGGPELALVALHRRMREIPKKIEAIDNELAGLSVEWYGKLDAWRAALLQESEVIDVLSRFGETDMTFVLRGWVAAHDVQKVELGLSETVGETTLIRRLPLTPELQKSAPVILHNPRPARSFESLVRLRSLPRYGALDPTWLMAVFMPVFFGMMLGDVGYGAILLGLCLLMLRRFGTGIIHDILVVLALGSVWSVVFGFLFGEAFGTLGEHLGMHAIWFDRASSEHVGALLVMTLAAGAAHMVLGLLLGVWEAVKIKSRSHLLESGGMLVGLMSSFLVVSVLVDLMPKGFMTAAIGGLVVGIALLSVPSGWVGVLLAPIEFISLIGNILSYLRIAAIGLASVYLAKVANEMAGKMGSLIIGVIVAVLIHSLNLAMGAFSPTIHSMRLHYVEFFRKFYQGGGRPFKPFGSG